jgi:hypothetical protein
MPKMRPGVVLFEFGLELAVVRQHHTALVAIDFKHTEGNAR